VRGELLFQRVDGLLEHAPMRSGTGGGEIAAGTQERQLDGPAAPQRVAFAWSGRPRAVAPQAVGLCLLELDVLAFESSSHVLGLSVYSLSGRDDRVLWIGRLTHRLFRLRLQNVAAC